MATEQTYTLDGPTEFFFPFPVRTAGEVVVELLPGGVLPSSEYEVIGASATATGITIRYPNAPRDGNTDLTITRVTNVDRVSTFLDDLSITATALNAEFDNFLAIIQDGIVNEYRGEWATETFYFELDVVLGPDDRVYVATESHTSDVFTDDVNVENYWRLVADFAAGQQNIDAAVDDAETARDKAEEWAENPEDVEVETGQFSAKHHAAKAEDSEIAAGNSEAAAQISEDNAATSEQNALTSEQNAATSEQNASNSASAALTSEQNAATSEQNAADSETAASNSASAALTSEQNAATSEQNASNSASAALTSEQNAATSEQNAATSEQNAATSAQNAADTLDNFESQYLGVKTQDPVTDNDGNPLQTGALYYNSTQGQLFLYDGSAWVSAAFDAEGFLIAGNNLSDIDSASVGRTNLGLSYQDVRDLFSAAGDLSYNNATGEFSTTQRTDLEIRNLFSSGGDLEYNSTTGEFSVILSPAPEIISANTNAVAGKLYVFVSSVTLTLPATPSPGDQVGFSNRSGTTTPVIDRNGENIMGVAENLTLDNENAFGTLIYADASEGWIFK